MLRLIVLLFFVSETSIASEPQCSRFHYEEKTLEKMIKLEFFVQKIKDDIDAIEKRVTDTLREIENKAENLKLDWENERDVAQEKLVEIKEISKAEIRKAEDEMKKIKELTTSITTPTVAFVAKISSGAGMSNGQTVVYGDVIMNEGNGYDNTTGIFTAPVIGTYLFTVQFCATPKDGVGYAVMSKEKEIKRSYLKDDLRNNCHSADAIDVLNKGDRVWIKCTDSTTEPEGDNYWTSFSGVLLHQ